MLTSKRYDIDCYKERPDLCCVEEELQKTILSYSCGLFVFSQANVFDYVVRTYDEGIPEIMMSIRSVNKAILRLDSLYSLLML